MIDKKIFHYFGVGNHLSHLKPKFTLALLFNAYTSGLFAIAFIFYSIIKGQISKKYAN